MDLEKRWTIKGVPLKDCTLDQLKKALWHAKRVKTGLSPRQRECVIYTMKLIEEKEKEGENETT